MTRNLTIVILAAGLGTRLGGLTKNRPKALTLVNGVPIIGYSLPWARLLNPKKIIVVGGYLFSQLEAAVRTIDPQAELVENAHFRSTQRMASLRVAQDKIEGDLAVFDGDYIYHHSLAEKIQSFLDGGSMKIFCTDEGHPYARLDMMVETDNKGHLVTMSKELTKFTHYFGSFFYCPEHLLPAYFATAEEVIRERGADKTHLEDAVVAYAKKGGTVNVVSVGSPRWIEVDTPEELSIAEKMITAEKGGYIA